MKPAAAGAAAGLPLQQPRRHALLLTRGGRLGFGGTWLPLWLAPHTRCSGAAGQGHRGGRHTRTLYCEAGGASTVQPRVEQRGPGAAPREAHAAKHGAAAGAALAAQSAAGRARGLPGGRWGCACGRPHARSLGLPASPEGVGGRQQPVQWRCADGKRAADNIAQGNIRCGTGSRTRHPAWVVAWHLQ